MQNDILKAATGSNTFAKKLNERPAMTKDAFERMVRDTKAKALAAGGEHVRTVDGFVCQSCNLLILTVRRDAGPTPEQMLCRRSSGLCQGMMLSAGYPPTIQHAERSASFEWIRPSYSFYIRIGNYTVRSFVDAGGLLLRQVGQLDPVGVEAMQMKPLIISAG
jgi:hypothetical protein